MPFEGLDDRLSLSLSAVVVVKTRSNVSLQHALDTVCSPIVSRPACFSRDGLFFFFGSG